MNTSICLVDAIPEILKRPVPTAVAGVKLSLAPISTPSRSPFPAVPIPRM